jgi:hypothetical protein
MNQRGTLQGVPASLTPEMAACQASQFVIDQGHQRIERGLIAFAALDQECCHIR